ncbi:synaptotagmin-like protein 2 [Xyrichtys novacula]|uniref:Synaptotagmin-like protein 2 n=1 Tax=Xyrichtys novacula TaxID=13765 RepID=A0AAV1FVT1_XYRNO|nr:synaptotagmin-like protein 2 [Xyrichtys novacula]
MIDLSFLTEEEQQSILAVLRRDAELKKAEEKRVQKLQKTFNNKDQLKYMTGEWFYETKQLRHQDRIHGSDIIRASMKHTQKPLTILELSHSQPERPSFVNSENKEVYVPPVLRGVLQEPPVELDNESPPHTPEHEPALVLQSPTKARINPFDADVIESYTSEEVDEAVDQGLTENEEPLSSCDDCLSHIDGPGGRHTISSAPRSILKHLSPSSSTNSLFACLELPSPDSLDYPSETWIDRKQVRFSSMVSRGGLDLQDGRELGEHSLLDVDFIAPPEDKNNTGIRGSVSEDTHGLSPGNQVISQEEERNSKNEAIIFLTDDVSGRSYLGFLSPPPQLSCAEQESDNSIHLETAPEDGLGSQTTTTDISVDATSESESSQPEQRLHEEKEKDNQTPEKEEDNISKVQDLDTNHVTSKCAADATLENHASVQQQAKSSELPEVRTLQLTAMQNTPFKETVTPVDTNIVVQHPERTSNLKTYVNKEKGAPKRVVAREEAGLKDAKKTGTEETLDPQTNRDVKSRSNNLPPQMEMKIQYTAGTSQEKKPSPQTDISRSVIFSEDDCTYRANPVVIYEEADDILTSYMREPEISETKEIIIPPKPSYKPVNSQKPEETSPDPTPRQPSPTPQEERRAKISDLKNFWEKEFIKSKEAAAHAPSRSSLRDKTHSPLSPQSHPQTITSSKEKSEAGGLTSPCKTKPNSVLKSVNVSNKGFVSQCPDMSQLKSPESPEVAPSSYHQIRDEADSGALKRPLSPGKPQSQKAKDQDEETKWSPSKTCHPRVLPREPSSPNSPRLDGSPLKTFPINIGPQTKNSEEPQGKPIPMPRERKSPTHQAKQMVLTETKPSESDGDVNTQQSRSQPPQPQPKTTPEKKASSLPRLARSVISQDYQHYLGPQEKAYVPPFTQESDVFRSPQKSSRNSSPKDSPKKSFFTLQNKVGNSSQDITTRTQSLSRASLGSCEETPRSIMAPLKRLSAKLKASSKSLENLTSKSGNDSSMDISKEPTYQSVEDVSSLPSSADLNLLQSSASVPLLQQDETDSDGPFETNLRGRINTGSSMSNLSLSSGLASMSSISGSTSSIYPSDFGDIEVQGSIQFALNYVQKLGEFHIFVVHCRDLAVADAKKNRSDPYVKCYLLPDKTKLGKRKTAVKKKTLSPDYNEILRYKIQMEVLKTQNLNVSVWHNDTFGRNSFLGDVDLDLSEWDFRNTHLNEYALKARPLAQTSSPTPTHLMDGRGQMRVALRFLPQTSHSELLPPV